MQYTSTKSNSRQRTEQTLIRANKNQIHGPTKIQFYISNSPLQNPIHHNISGLSIDQNVNAVSLEEFERICPNFGRAIYCSILFLLFDVEKKEEVELLFSGHGTKYLMLAYLLLSGLFPLLFICTLVNLIVKHFFVFAF